MSEYNFSDTTLTLGGVEIEGHEEEPRMSLFYTLDLLRDFVHGELYILNEEGEGFTSVFNRMVSMGLLTMDRDDDKGLITVDLSPTGTVLIEMMDRMCTREDIAELAGKVEPKKQQAPASCADKDKVWTVDALGIALGVACGWFPDYEFDMGPDERIGVRAGLLVEPCVSKDSLTPLGQRLVSAVDSAMHKDQVEAFVAHMESFAYVEGE